MDRSKFKVGAILHSRFLMSVIMSVDGETCTHKIIKYPKYPEEVGTIWINSFRVLEIDKFELIDSELAEVLYK